jgi:hypothetical protein
MGTPLRQVAHNYRKQGQTAEPIRNAFAHSYNDAEDRAVDYNPSDLYEETEDDVVLSGEYIDRPYRINDYP